MARERMVTRTIVSTTVEVMCVDTLKAEVTNKEVIMSTIGLNEKQTMQVLEKMLKPLKPVQIVKTTETETLYGMTEQEFITVAKKLESRFGNKEKTE